MRALLLVFSLLLLTGCGTRPLHEINRGALIQLHNEARSSSGAHELQIDLNLDDKAQTHAEWMAKRESLKHSNLDGDYPTMGENIAAGQTDEEAVVNAWMKSSGHRRNILNQQFDYVGFGYAESKQGVPYWCTLFGGNLDLN